jgi:hypothetical protein
VRTKCRNAKLRTVMEEKSRGKVHEEEMLRKKMPCVQFSWQELSAKCQVSNAIRTNCLIINVMS